MDYNMRARTVNTTRAYCFDFDDVLIKSDAKVKVFSGGKYVRSLSPSQYNTYKRSPEDELDFLDFEEPEHIFNAKKYKMWPVLKRIHRAIEDGRSDSEIYILTARHLKVKPIIIEFLKKEGININPAHVITIGDAEGKISIADKKKEVLRKLADMYSEIHFFDDDIKNIELAKQIPKIKTRLIETNINN